MRVTNKVLVNDFLSNLHRNLENMQKYQDQLSSGLEVRKPSDDPFKVSRTMELNADIAANDRYKTNIEEGSGWMDTTETALSQMGDALQRIRELTVSAGNGSYDSEEQNAIKSELVQLKDQLMQIGNTAFDGRYVFGGDATDNPPFVKDANGNIFYKGSNTGLVKEFSQGVTMDIGSLGSEFAGLFSTTGAVTQTNNSMGNLSVTGNYSGTASTAYDVRITSVDVNGTVTGAQYRSNSGTWQSATLVSAGTFTIPDGNGLTISVAANVNNKDFTTTNNTYSFTAQPNIMDRIVDKVSNNVAPTDLLGDLDAHINNILKMRADNGAKQNRLDAMKSKNEDETYNMTQLLSKTQDIDVAQKVMEYKVMENVYNASLQTGARILQPSLLDFLK